MKQKVLVCGASGFIGQNIMRRLAGIGKHDVYGTVHRSPPPPIKDVTFIHGDLTHAEEVQSALRDKDIIIHAAARTSGAKDIIQQPSLHVTDNAVMNSLIFRQAHECGVKHLVFFSCSVMYPALARPVKEEDFSSDAEMNPKYFGVGWTKVYSEKMCEFYARLGRTRFTVIRHSNIYGPNDKYDLERSHVFGATVTKVMAAKGGKISVWGTGQEGRDLLHVDDLVDFVETALVQKRPAYDLVNVGMGRAFTVDEMVGCIARAAGKSIAIEHDLSAPTIPTTLVMDITKAKRDYGWAPRISFDEGIRRTIKWYQAEYHRP